MKLFLPLLLTACVAWAQADVQGKPDLAAPPAEASPADTNPVTPPAPPADVPPLLPPAFHDQVMSWDSEHHQALQGFARKALSREEFFTAINRPDLVEKASSMSQRRFILGGSAILVLAAGAISGAVVLATNVDLNSQACTVAPNGTYDINKFNACTDQHKTNGMIGGGLIALGVIGAGLLATFAYWSRPEVVDDDEAQRLISQFNGELLKRLRLNAMLLPGGGAVGVSTRF